MSILKVNDIQRATTGSSAVIFDDPVIITTGSISASVITAGQFSSSRLINYDVPKEKLTDDARSWVNILNKPTGLLSSSAQLPAAISGSIITPSSVTASGTIFTTGYFSGSGVGITGLNNSSLAYSSITINGTSVSLGGTRDITTAQITESTNLYYTDARVKSKLSAEGVVSASGQINYQSVTGQPSVNTLGSDGNKSFTLGSGMFITASGGADGIVVTNDAANYTLRFKTVTGTVSSSAQVQSALPAGIVSSSTQINTGSFSGSITSASYVSPSGLPSGTVSSSTQVKTLLPADTVSSSAQYPGWVTASSQINYNSITNKLSGTVSSSAQVQPLLPAGTVSSSDQVALGSITGTTFANATFTFPSDLTVSGNLTAKQFYTVNVSSSVIYQSGSTKFGDTSDDIMSVTGSIRVLGGTISGSMVGMFSGSSQVDYNSITNKLSGVVSSSAQVAPLLPGGTVSSSTQTLANLPTGTVSSSAQYAGWVTASSQIDYNSITNKLSGVVSASAQVAPLLPAGTVSSSGQVSAGNTANFATAVAAQLSTVHSGSYLGTATTNNLGEGVTNFYYTDARVKTKISTDNVHSGSYLGTATTVNLSEDPSGSNLYFTTARVIGALPPNTVSSSNQVITFLPAGTVSGSGQISPVLVNSASTAVTASYALLSQGTTANNTDGLPEGTTNLYYLDSRVKTKLSAENVHSGSYLGTATTTGLTEGTNLYFTNIRAVAALPIGTVSSSGQVSYTGLSNIPSGIFSSSAQLPAGTVSQSAGTITVDGTNSIIGINTTSPSTLTKLHVNGALMVENGVTSTTAFKDGIIFAYTGGSSQYRHKIATRHDAIAGYNLIEFLVATGASTSASILTLNGTNPSSFYKGLNVTGSFAVQGSISGGLVLPVDTVSSSTQVKTFLPGGTVSSSTQTLVNLPTGTVSSSIQINTGSFSGSFTGAFPYASLTSIPSGIFSSSVQLPAGTVSSSVQINTGSFSGSFAGNITSTQTSSLAAVNMSGVISGSGNYRMVVPVGTNLYAT